ncbi:MAG TPA: ComEC/Rec2 family competence protein [Jiangellaceae bacterium]
MTGVSSRDDRTDPLGHRPVDQPAPGGPDLRLVPAAVAAWAGVIAGLTAASAVLAGLGVAAATAALVVSRRVARKPVRLAALVVVLCFVGGGATGWIRAASVRAGPVDELAAAGAVVTVEGVLTSDASVRRTGVGPRRSAYVVGRLRVEEVTGRGTATRVRTPVVLLATDLGWADLRPGQQVVVRGRLEPADGWGDTAGLLRVRDPPDPQGPPGWASTITEPLRAGLREAVAGLEEGPRGLVPALVVGDESLMTDQVRDDMKISGLLHLNAVSGTNVTIVLVAVLGLARWVGVRGYGLPALGVSAVVGFVLLARPEPSVVRAAVMGVVALVGLTAAGRRRGVPSLSAAVLVLLFVDPWLGIDAGFALSVLATGGILLLARRWRDAMPWVPRPLAEALAVPLAAQVSCIPVVVVVAAQASLASIPANILVAPAVAPATVFGAAAAVVSTVSPVVASGLGWVAGLPATWIVLVARRGADLPGAVVGWPGGASGVMLAVGLAAGSALVLPAVLRRPLTTTASAGVVLLLLVWVPTPGWPPPRWLVVACDVGQGDALVLRAGEASGVVVDVGPAPRAVDRCLESLGIERVPLLVLTHFHADHVEGLTGLLAGRHVGQAVVSPLADPREQAEDVAALLSGARVPVAVARAGDQFMVVDAVRLRVLWPRRIIEAGSMANNASIVLDAEVDGVRIMLAGDLEPEAQRALLAAEPGLSADVLKVPHHGSAHQEPDLLRGLDARVALISAGADNTYGHPAPATIGLLDVAGAEVRRTDLDGSIAVVRTSGGGLGVVTGGPRVAPP